MKIQNILVGEGIEFKMLNQRVSFRSKRIYPYDWKGTLPINKAHCPIDQKGFLPFNEDLPF
jgi:hypothetical protein